KYPSREEADASEELIRRYADASRQEIDGHIWPKFQKLMEQDIQDSALQELLKELAQQNAASQEGSGRSLPPTLTQLTEQEQQELEKAIQQAQNQQLQQSKATKPIDMASLPHSLIQKLQQYIQSLSEDEQTRLR